MKSGFSIGFSLVGGRLATGGRSGKGASGAGVGCVELHIDCVLERIDEARDSARNPCVMSGTSSNSSTVELFLDLDFIGIWAGCECRALARLSEAVDFIACSRGPDIDVVAGGSGGGAGRGTVGGELGGSIGDASIEPRGTGVDRTESNDCGDTKSVLAPRELEDVWTTCAALRGRFGMLGLFLLYFDVGTVGLRTDDIDERADAGTGAVGNCICSTLGTELPGITKTFSSRTAAGASTVLAPLLEVTLSPEMLDELPMSFASGWCELPIS